MKPSPAATCSTSTPPFCDPIASLVSSGLHASREAGAVNFTEATSGFKSILGSLGTDEFIRVRMGVQPEQQWGDRKDYVLCTMGREERRIAQEEVVEAADAVEVILTEGLEKAMSRFNRKATPSGESTE